MKLRLRGLEGGLMWSVKRVYVDDMPTNVLVHLTIRGQDGYFIPEFYCTFTVGRRRNDFEEICDNLQQGRYRCLNRRGRDSRKQGVKLNHVEGGVL